MPEEPTKTCNICHQTLPLTMFSPDKRGANGIRAWCKPCSAEKARAYRNDPANIDRCRERVRAYHATHKAEAKVRSHEYYLKTQEHNLEYAREYQKAHPENKKKNNKLYRERHNTELRAQSRNYYQEHKEEINSKQVRAIAAKRMSIIAAHGGKCSVCGYNANHRALEFHHVNPIDKEGREVYSAYEAEKCVLLCNRCHREHHCGGIQYTAFALEAA